MNNLPTGVEPLVLADGTRIDPINGGVIKDDEVLVEVPNTAEIKREIAASHMRISDLPVPPKQMNTLSIILSYSLQGISDKDVANLLAISIESLNNTKIYKILLYLRS